MFGFGDTTSKHKSPRTIRKPNTICFFIFILLSNLFYVFYIADFFFFFFWFSRNRGIQFCLFVCFRFKATVNFNGEELLDAEPLISTRFVLLYIKLRHTSILFSMYI